MHAYVSRMWAAAMDRAARIEIGDLFPLTAFEQTRRSWATRVESYDEAPDIYKTFFERLPADAFPYTVITPTFEGFFHRENEKLVCSPDDNLYILERVKGDLVCTAYPLRRIN